MVKAEDCKSSIPRFESGRRLDARLAQWLERLLDMQEVAGSSPAPGTIKNRIDRFPVNRLNQKRFNCFLFK